MGLHLCYRLTLPGDTTIEDVRARLSALHSFASTVGFQAVHGPAEYSIDELVEERDHREIVPIIVSTLAGDVPDFHGFRSADPCVTAFVIAPGKHCEPAVLGFIPPGSRATYPDSDDDLCPDEWFWSGACKTQYASLVSHDHLIRCHVGLVRVLEHAATLGIGVSVEDETGYWEHRSTEKLIVAVEDMNRLIAKFAGALSDRLGDAHHLDAPIFEHAEFEHLEMEPPASGDQADGAK
jgi:hypothetical protein